MSTHLAEHRVPYLTTSHAVDDAKSLLQSCEQVGPEIRRFDTSQNIMRLYRHLTHGNFSKAEGHVEARSADSRRR